MCISLIYLLYRSHVHECVHSHIYYYVDIIVYVYMSISLIYLLYRRHVHEYVDAHIYYDIYTIL